MHVRLLFTTFQISIKDELPSAYADSYYSVQPLSCYSCGSFRTFPHTVESTVHGMNSMLMVTSLVPFGSGTVRQRVELGTSRTTSALHSRRKFFFSIWKEASLLLRSYGRLARSVCIIHQMSILTFQSEIFRKIRQSFRKSFSKI